MRSVADLAVEGRRVLVRCDLNVPLEDGVITDDGRIRASVPTLRELLDAGATVVFGTDGTAPDRTFDVLEKVRFGMWVQRQYFRDTHLIPPGKALEMVTVDAARALRLPDLGSLEPGKLADVTLVDLRRPHLAPIAMVPQRLAYMASGQDVDTVIVDGVIRMRGRTVLGVDEQAIVADATREMWAMVERADVAKYMGIPDGFWGGVRY